MTHHPSSPDPVSGTPCVSTRAQVHAAFDDVALSLSCTLPMLLDATRARGVLDDDVRTMLTADETEHARGVESEMHLLCGRSNAGVLYVTRDTAATNESVSAFEAFRELWREQRG